MKTVLAENGYQVVTRVFSLGEIANMRAAISETIDRTAAALRTPFEMSFPDVPLEERLDRIATQDRVYAMALYRAILADCHRDERILAMPANDRLSETVVDLLSPLQKSGQTIRARAALSAFSDARSPWHQDVLQEGPGCGSVRLACWIPLSDVGPSNGALEVAAGSWRGSLPHSQSSDGRFYISDEAVPEPNRQVVSLQQGDVLFLDRFIPHRSLPTQRGRARWAIVIWIKGS